MLADCDAGALRELVQRVRTLADTAIERGASRGVIDRAAWRPLKLLSVLWCANRASRLVLDDLGRRRKLLAALRHTYDERGAQPWEYASFDALCEQLAALKAAGRLFS